MADRSKSETHQTSVFYDEDGVERCNDVFGAYVRKGSVLPINHHESKVWTPPSRDSTRVDIGICSSDANQPRYTTDYGVEYEGCFTMDIREDMHLGRQRQIEITMFFGKATIEVQGRRVNFGNTRRIENLRVEMRD